MCSRESQESERRKNKDKFDKTEPTKNESSFLEDEDFDLSKCSLPASWKKDPEKQRKEEKSKIVEKRIQDILSGKLRLNTKRWNVSDELGEKCKDRNEDTCNELAGRIRNPVQNDAALLSKRKWSAADVQAKRRREEKGRTTEEKDETRVRGNLVQASHGVSASRSSSELTTKPDFAIKVGQDLKPGSGDCSTVVVESSGCVQTTQHPRSSQEIANIRTAQRLQALSKEKERGPVNKTAKPDTSQATLSKQKPYKCDTCGRSFPKNSSLTIHLRTHTGEKPYTCDTCGKSFAKQGGLTEHQITHTGEKPFTCTTCGKSFAHKSSLTTHLRTHTGEKRYTCNTCGKSFVQHTGLTRHLRTHTGEKLHTCNTCGKSFAQQYTLTEHLRTHTGEKPYTCDVCGKSFPQKSALRAHLKTHTGEKPYSCDTCGKTFTQKGGLTTHLRTHTGEKRYSCDTCGKTFTQQGGLTEHLRTHSGEKPYTCDTCGKSFAKQGGLTTHHITHTGEKPFTCTTCGKSFAHKSSLTIHLRTHSGEKPYTCDTCRKSFAQNSSLTTHQTTHTGVKPYTCDLCEMRFPQKGGLTEHLMTHTGEKPYTCETCGKTFPRNRSLTEHLRTHTGEKPYTCDVCGKPFPQKSDLRTHLRTHSGEKPYSCDTCGKSFTQKGGLTTHLRTHTGEKQFTCETCGKSFAQQGYFTAHRRTHSGESPFKCEICGESFPQSRQLRKHKRYEDCEQTSQQSAESTICGETSPRLYKCVTCGKNYLRRRALAMHWHRQHEERDAKREKHLEKCRNYNKTRKGTAVFKTAQASYAQREKERIRNERQSGIVLGCSLCPYKSSCRANLATHNMKKHSQTPKALALRLKMSGINGYRRLNQGKHPPSHVLPGSANFHLNTTRVKHMINALRVPYNNPNRPHGVYMVAILPLKARQMGVVEFLRTSKADVKLYIGKSQNGEPSPYHTIPSKCHRSSIMKELRPGSNQCAFLCRSIIFDGESHAINKEKAEKAETQFQIMMAANEMIKPSNDGVKWKILNKSIETHHISEEEKAMALRFGSFGFPPIMTECALPGDVNIAHPKFASGHLPYKTLNPDEHFKEITYVEPLLPFRAFDEGKNCSYLKALSIENRNKYAAEQLSTETLFDTHTKFVRKYLPTLETNQSVTHGIYVIVILPEETARMGLYSYLKQNEGDASVEASIYVGISSDGLPSAYHSLGDTCHTSLVNRAIRPGSGKSAFLVKSEVWSTESQKENYIIAQRAESQIQLMMLAHETTSTPDRMTWRLLNKVITRPEMAEDQRRAALRLGTLGVPPVYVNKSFIPSGIDMRHPDFLENRRLHTRICEGTEYPELRYTEPLIAF